MAFTKRIWLPHDVQYPGRKILIPTGNPNEYDLNRSEGTINAVGDLLSAENLNELENRIFTNTELVVTSLTLINGWTSSYNARIYRSGPVAYLCFSGSYTGTANTVLAVLPSDLASNNWVSYSIGAGSTISIQGASIVSSTTTFSENGYTYIVN